MSPAHKTHVAQTGFTLIEVLVVLILMGLITGVLFQALERAYRLNERFGISLANVQQGQMATDWYRQSINGLFPDFADGAHLFQGKPQRLSGLSTNPISTEAGASTPITWELKTRSVDNITELIHTEGSLQTQIMSWRSTESNFIYLDEKGEPHM